MIEKEVEGRDFLVTLVFDEESFDDDESEK